MSRIHPAALAALAAEAARVGQAFGFEAWLQTPHVAEDGAVVAAVWDGAGPASSLRAFVAATPYGATVTGSDVVQVAADARALMESEDRVLG